MRASEGQALFERVSKDEDLKELMRRAEDDRLYYNDGTVLVFGYSPTGKLTYPSIYSNKAEYTSQFTSERSRFNGRIVAHTMGSREYECLTDVVDSADKELNGKWVIMGYGAENPAKEKPFIIKEFSNEQEMNKGKDSVIKQIDQMALVHQYGRTDYTLVKTYNSRSESVILITDGLQGIARALVEATRKAELKEPDAPFTEGKLIDLREEDLRQ